MGGQNKTPPVPAAPNYSGITSSFANNAQHSTALADEMYNWAKSAYAKNQNITDDVVAGDLETQDDLRDFASTALGRYSDKYTALEDQQIDEAQNYASDARRQKEIGAAQASVAQQFEAARQSAQRELESYGINPASTRFAALDIGVRTNKAAAEAAAGTNASNQVDATARQLRNEAINTGQEDVGAATSASNAATSAGTAATNAGLNLTTSGASSMGTPTQWSTLANNALGVWGNTLNQSYGNQMSQYNAQNQQNKEPTGWGAALGAGVGLASNLIAPGSGSFIGPAATAGANALFSAKGGAVEDDEDEDNKPYVDHHYYVLPLMDEAGHRMSPDEAIQRYHHTRNHLGVYPSDKAAFAAHGGPIGEEPGVVPEEASPTGGAAVDDVKAQLTAGEFVIPEDVVSWYGQKHFYNIIAKAQAERDAAKQSTGAVPEEGTEQPGPTTFRSGDAALPAE